MTVLYWTPPARERVRGVWTETGRTRTASKHVSIDGAETVCGYPVPAGAVVVAVTRDWHEHANCYNCVYRLWPDHAPPGYLRPADGGDFPLRRECPHAPGLGRDPAGCRECTPALARPSPARRRLPRRRARRGRTPGRT